MPHSRADESSVVFNLRQLMQLEDARIHAEREAVLSARAAEERERLERERRGREATARAEAERWAVLARLQVEADSAARAETERQAELLRVRLAHEAAERRDREELAAADHRARAVKRGAAWVVSTLAAGCVLVALVRAPAAPIPAAADRGAAIEAQYAREVASLKERIAALTVLTNHVANTSETTPEPAPAVLARRPREKQHGRPLPVKKPAEKDALGDIESADQDPIRGLQ